MWAALRCPTSGGDPPSGRGHSLPWVQTWLQTDVLDVIEHATAVYSPPATVTATSPPVVATTITLNVITISTNIIVIGLWLRRPGSKADSSEDATLDELWWEYLAF